MATEPTNAHKCIKVSYIINIVLFLHVNIYMYLTSATHLTQNGHRSGQIMYEEYYVYNVRYFQSFMCICCFHTLSNTNSLISKYMQKISPLWGYRKIQIIWHKQFSVLVTSGVPRGGVFKPPPPKFRRLSKIVPNSPI